MIPKKSKRGFMGLLITFFFGLVLLLVLTLIFKNQLKDLFSSFTDFYKSRTFWILIILGLVALFRKFVLEVLMMILKLVRGILHV